jgi:phenylacetate-CoA ligase
LEEKLKINAFNIYGLSEIMGPGVSHECECKNGSHIIEDHFFPEIINPETCEVLPEGEQGELVFTTLTKEGMPLLRYRTKDLCSLIYEPCECGRTSVRMTRIMGRSDDMLIIRGINVFPSQIESVIIQLPEFEPQYLLVVTRENNRDNLEVQVELKEEFYSDEINKTIEMRDKLARRLQSVLSISADVKIVSPNTLERSLGKSKRVIDKRVLE